jgi:hypothetical protein
MNKHGVICSVLQVLMLPGFVSVTAAEPSEPPPGLPSVRLPSISDDLLAHIGRKRVPDWLRCPRFFTMDSRRDQIKDRKAGTIAAAVRRIVENEGNTYRLGVFWGGEAYYQSNVAPHAPGLGDVDYLREALDKGRRSDVRIIAYMNPNCLYPDHPLFAECAIRDSRGQIWSVSAYGRRFPDCRYACVNHPKYRKFLLDTLTEIFTRYGPAGFYIDGLSPHVCFCVHCKARYRKLFDADMPAKFEKLGPFTVLWEMTSRPELVGDPTDPDSERLTRLLYETLVDVTRDFTQTVKRCKPDAVTLYHSWPKPDNLQYYDGTLGEIYVRNPWVHDLWKYGELAAFGSVFPVPVLGNIYLTENSDLYLVESPETRPTVHQLEATHKMVQTLANGTFPNCWHFDGMKPFFRFLRENADCFDFAVTTPVRFLAFPRGINHDSVQKKIIAKYGQFPQDRFLTPYVGMYSALLRAGLPIVTLHRPEFHAGLSGFQVLCLANESSMTDRQADAVRQFVAAGGGLIATFETSLYDQQGRRRPDFALADVLGAAYEDTRPEAKGKTNIPAAHPLADACRDLPHAGPHVLVRPTNGRCLARIGPDGPPAVIVNEFGRGRVVYLPGRLDAMQCQNPTPTIERLLAQAVGWVAHERLPVEVRSPAPVGVTLFDQPSRRLLHLVNHNARSAKTDYNISPIENLDVRLRIPADRQVTALRRLWDKADVPFDRNDDTLSFRVANLQQYEVIVADLK